MPTTSPHPAPGQPPVFWITIVGVVLAVVLIAARVATGGSQAGPFLTGAIVGVVICVLVVGFYALTISGRMNVAKRKLPNALLIPVTVGTESAVASARLAEQLAIPSLRLKASSYATFGVDQDGLHFIVDGPGSWGTVPAPRVHFAGYSSTILGTRSMQSIVLAIDTGHDTLYLPLVPMRIRGNPVRALSPEELENVAGLIQSSLKGTVNSGWKF